MKFKIFTAAAAAAMMTACSSDEPVINNGNTGTGDENGSYIAVRISDAMSSPLSKADPYETGTPEERRIDTKKLSFYLFNADGTPFKMNDVTNQVIPVVENLKPGDVDNKPETDTNATSFIILNIPNTGTRPAKIVAVVNAENINGYANESTANLLEKNTRNITTGSGANEVFIMTSVSSWDPVNKKPVFWSDIVDKNFQTDRKLAIDNPVDIYVERLAAKVEIASFPTDSKVYDKAGNDKQHMTINLHVLKDDGTVETEKRYLYAKQCGWGLNTTASNTYSFKNLADFSAGTNAIFSGNAWYTDGGRTFWASHDGNILTPNAFTPSDLFAASTLTPTGNYAYLRPNTCDPFLTQGDNKGGRKGMLNYALSGASKVLVGVNVYAETDEALAENAQPDEIMLWAGDYYTPEALCKVLSTNNNGETVCFSRDATDTYKVNFYRIAGDANKGQQGKLIDKDVIANNTAGYKIMANIPTAQYWAGMGYYIINIASDIPGKDNKTVYGVVRNQVYRYTLDNFIGLGTPVVDPGLDVLPENPVNSETYIAARLNVLRWRVVSHKVSLE